MTSHNLEIEDWVRRHDKDIRRFLGRITSSADQASDLPQDLAQDTYVKLLGLNSPSTVRTPLEYLLAAARRL